jgi:DNA-binding response OmpR family regulator
MAYRPTYCEHIAEIERLLAIKPQRPLCFKVSRSERILMELLLRRSILSRAVAIGVLYGHRLDADHPKDITVNAIICSLRKQLASHDITITTEYGVGWYMTTENKHRLRKLIERVP